MRPKTNIYSLQGNRTFRAFLVLTFLSCFVSLAFFPNNGFAEMQCASRPLVKGQLSDFRDNFRTYITETSLLTDSDNTTRKTEKGVRETYFSRFTRLYFDRDFYPRDTVCIVSENEDPRSLQEAGVWDAFSGTTVILAPFPVTPVGSLYRSSKVDFLEYFADAVANGKTSDFELSCRSKFKIDDECVRRKLTEQKSTYLSEIKNDIKPAANKAIAYTYNADHTIHQYVYEAFVISVATLEATNYPFYSTPQVNPADLNFKQYSVYDPLTDRRLPVTTLLRFLGLDLVESSIRHLFDWFFSLEDHFEPTTQDDIVAVELKRLTAATEWTFPLSNTLDQMKRAYVCSNDGSAGLDLSALDFDSVLLSFRFVCVSEAKTQDKGGY